MSDVNKIKKHDSNIVCLDRQNTRRTLCLMFILLFERVGHNIIM